jgi:hypothetical protein
MARLNSCPSQNRSQSEFFRSLLGHFHLVGSDGMLAQLEADGMTVRRI